VSGGWQRREKGPKEGGDGVSNTGEGGEIGEVKDQGGVREKRKKI